MIITKTPYRVSFVGGGSDLPAYCDHAPGMVVSTTIDRYIWVSVSPRWEDSFRIRYGSGDEHVTKVDEVEHPIVRECLKLHAVDRPLEIVITGDLPGGTGLGSSSSLTVGLLGALDAMRGRRISAKALAQQACLIEIGRLRRSIGYQDQYAAAFGGLNEIRFKAKGSVWVEPIELARSRIEEIERHALMVYVGGQRSADEILERQSNRVAINWDATRGMAELAGMFRDEIRAGSLRNAADTLHRAWELKRSIVDGITNIDINMAYCAAIAAGAWGGKLLGAGGGGFLLFLAPPEKHDDIRKVLALKELPFRMSIKGVEVVYDDGVR